MKQIHHLVPNNTFRTERLHTSVNTLSPMSIGFAEFTQIFALGCSARRWRSTKRVVQRYGELSPGAGQRSDAPKALQRNGLRPLAGSAVQRLWWGGVA